MVKIVAFEGKHKLANRWEEEPYVVLDRPNPDIPVYIVRKENGEKRKITLHRNLLLPIGTINLSDNLDQTVTSKKPTPAPRRKKITLIREQRQQYLQNLGVKKLMNHPTINYYAVKLIWSAG